MMIRISLIVAIVAGLAVGALNFIKVREKITTLQTNLASETSQREQAQRELATAKTDLEKTKAELAETNVILQAALVDKDKAVQEASTQGKRASALAEDLAKTKQERDEAQQELAAYRATGYSPDQVMGLGRLLKQTQETLAGVQAENKVLARKIERLEYRLAKYEGEVRIVYLPANLNGKILVSDPKWDFVVLNIGEDQGVKEAGELLVNRGGKLVAKVVVRSVQKDRAIANVMPGWRLGDVLEGDQVIPAHPAS
jgi:hypothetical protein